MRKALSLTVALALPFVLSGCGKTYSYKYKIMISIRDHGEVKTGSNVVSVQESPTFMHGIAPPILCGEATVVRLNNNRFVFALLNGVYREPVRRRPQWYSSPTVIFLARYGLSLDWSAGDDGGIRALPSIRRPITLVSYELPEFVTFKDVNDPTSIVQIDPEHPESALGEGVSFQSVTLETTDEWVTRGEISKVLPWLDWAWLSRWGYREYIDGSEYGKSVHAYKTFQFLNCNRLTE